MKIDIQKKLVLGALAGCIVGVLIDYFWPERPGAQAILVGSLLGALAGALSYRLSLPKWLDRTYRYGVVVLAAMALIIMLGALGIGIFRAMNGAKIEPNAVGAAVILVILAAKLLILGDKPVSTGGLVASMAAGLVAGLVSMIVKDLSLTSRAVWLALALLFFGSAWLDSRRRWGLHLL